MSFDYQMAPLNRIFFARKHLMDQTSSLCKAHNPKMFLGDLADRTSFATPQMDWIDPPRTTSQAGISRFLDFVMLY